MKSACPRCIWPGTHNACCERLKVVVERMRAILDTRTPLSTGSWPDGDAPLRDSLNQAKGGEMAR